MYRLQVDSISKASRKPFKEGLIKALDGKFNVYFAPENRAIVEITEPVFVTEESLTEKNTLKKKLTAFLGEFRMYQFNNNL